MRSDLCTLHILLVLPLWLVLSGCHATPSVVSMEMRAAEKDVLVCDVELAQPLPASAYLDWAEESVAAREGGVQNPFFETPVYELLYAFRVGSEPLATVLYRVDPEAGELHHHRTLVYHSEERVDE